MELLGSVTVLAFWRVDTSAMLVCDGSVHVWSGIFEFVYES